MVGVAMRGRRGTLLRLTTTAGLLLFAACGSVHGESRKRQREGERALAQDGSVSSLSLLPDVRNSHAEYGGHGYLGFDEADFADIQGFTRRFGKKAFFSVPPTVIRRQLCRDDEPDPIGKACSPWPFLPGHFNPSLIEIPEDSPFRTVGRYFAVARRIGEKGVEWFGGTEVYKPAQVNNTETVVRPTVVLLGEDMRVRALTLLYDAVHPAGWVDVRLFTMGDEWWVHFRAPVVALGEVPRRGAQAEDFSFRSMIARVDFTVTLLGDYTSLVATLDPNSFIPMEGAIAGKNHMFFQDGDEDFSLVMLNPLKIHRVHRENNIIAQEAAYEQPPNPSLPGVKGLHLNGGRLVYLPETDEYLGMAHHLFSNIREERQPHYLRRYTNLLFTLKGSAPYGLSRVSTEFCFESATKEGDCEMIQFAAGFSVDVSQTTLLVPYGINRHESKLFTMSLTDALEMLRPASELAAARPRTYRYTH